MAPSSLTPSSCSDAHEVEPCSALQESQGGGQSQGSHKTQLRHLHLGFSQQDKFSAPEIS